jgi:hypothetical protein
LLTALEPADGATSTLRTSGLRRHISGPGLSSGPFVTLIQNFCGDVNPCIRSRAAMRPGTRRLLCSTVRVEPLVACKHRVNGQFPDLWARAGGRPSRRAGPCAARRRPASWQASYDPRKRSGRT